MRMDGLDAYISRRGKHGVNMKQDWAVGMLKTGELNIPVCHRVCPLPGVFALNGESRRSSRQCPLKRLLLSGDACGIVKARGVRA